MKNAIFGSMLMISTTALIFTTSAGADDHVEGELPEVFKALTAKEGDVLIDIKQGELEFWVEADVIGVRKSASPGVDPNYKGIFIPNNSGVDVIETDGGIYIKLADQ